MLVQIIQIVRNIVQVVQIVIEEDDEEEKVGEWAENHVEGEGDTVTDTSDVLQYNSNTSAVHFRLNTLSAMLTCFDRIVKLTLTAANFVIFLVLGFDTTST